MDRHISVLALMGVVVALIYLHASGKLALGMAGRQAATDSAPPPPRVGVLSPEEIARIAQEAGASLLEPFVFRDAFGRTFTVNPQLNHVALGGG